MTEDTGAAAPTDTETVTGAESEQATQVETSATSAGTENAEAGNQEQTAPEGDDDQSDEPRRLNRTQRLQRKAARLSTIVAEQAAELERLRQAANKSGSESEPKEADYNGDWTKWQADYAAWKAAQTVEQKFFDREQREIDGRLKAAQLEAVEEFEERAAEFKKITTDFDKVIDDFVKAGGSFSQALADELRDSDVGPALAYQLASNPKKVAQLNAMSARDLAREIGRLEAKVPLPNPKKQTSAPKPIVPPSGGATPPKDPSRMSMDEYVKWRAGGNG